MSDKDILFDARHIENEYSGLARYTYSLLEGLISVKRDGQKVVVVLRNIDYEGNTLYKKIIDLLSFDDSIEYRCVKYKNFSFGNYFFMRKFVNKYQGFEYVYPHFDKPLGVSIRSKSIFHDLFPLVVDGYFVNNSLLKSFAFYLLCTFTLISRKNEIIAISNSTRSDILKFFPFIDKNKVRVVLSSDCLAFCSDIVAREGKYLFYIGDRRPHKNLKKMLDIFKVLKEKYFYDGEFIIAGSEENHEFCLDQYIEGMEGVKVLGKLDDRSLQEYYKGMDSLFFLSKYEGFGLPVLEAARFNSKVITSNISSLPEVSPESALLISPFDDSQVSAKAIDEYLKKNVGIDNSKFLSSFSWQNTALGIFYNE